MTPNYALARKLRELNGKVSQYEAAKRLNVSQSCISSCCKAHNIVWIRQHREQTGSNNHNFKTGLSRSTVRKLVKYELRLARRDLFTCERCGERSQIELPRHHKDRDRSHNTSDNIEILCVTCHNLEHMPERQRDANGRLLPKI